MNVNVLYSTRTTEYHSWHTWQSEDK